MDKNRLKKKNLRKLIVLYIMMTAVVITSVFFIIMVVMGFGYDANKGKLEQYGFLYFSSTPSGANVTVDGKLIGSKTPNKVNVSAGKHTVLINKDGYEAWSKTVESKAGVISWLNYAILIPKKIEIESLVNYDAIVDSLTSPKSHYMILQSESSTPTFDLVDISSNTIKSTKLTIPKTLYSEADTAGVAHSFSMEKWDSGERYVLIKHNYGDKSEWLVLDNQDAGVTKNITKLFNISISQIYFADTGGNKFYVLDTNDVRKLDLGAGTISKSLVSNVKSFAVSDLNVITFISKKDETKDQQIAGIYLESSDKSYALRTTNGSADLHISTAHYFKEDYVAISEGKKVDIFGGSYPNSDNKEATSLSVIKTINLDGSVNELNFSPAGEYVFIRSGSSFTTYDLEYNNLNKTNITSQVVDFSIKWLDNSNLWSDADSSLSIREFDGANYHKINNVLLNQDIALNHDKSYIYSINKVGEKYQLQRVKLKAS